MGLVPYYRRARFARAWDLEQYVYENDMKLTDNRYVSTTFVSPEKPDVEYFIMYPKSVKFATIREPFKEFVEESISPVLRRIRGADDNDDLSYEIDMEVAALIYAYDQMGIPCTVSRQNRADVMRFVIILENQ